MARMLASIIPGAAGADAALAGGAGGRGGPARSARGGARATGGGIGEGDGIGKMGIDPATLAKAAPVSAAEWRAVNRHAEAGAEMLASFPELGRARELVLAHHEWFDGTGYPRGLAGERLPFGARVIAVADTWDAMITGRAHRWSLPPARGRGTQFDPAVVDAFRRVLEAQPELAAPPREEGAGHAPRVRAPRPEEAPGSA